MSGIKLSAKEFREKINTGQLSINNKGRIVQNELIPEYKEMLEKKGLKIKLKGSTRDNKYNNVIVEYNGNKYQSKKECEYAKNLDLKLKAKQIDYWKGQVKFKCEVIGTHVCNYYLDFEFGQEGISRYIDVKGVQTDVFKLKKRLVEALKWTWNEDKQCYISSDTGKIKVKIELA